MVNNHFADVGKKGTMSLTLALIILDRLNTTERIDVERDSLREAVKTVSFAAAFGIHFMLFQTRGYSCVHGIQMIFYGLNTWGCGIMAAICGGRK